MVSRSLELKRHRQRQMAAAELPKVRVCASIVLSMVALEQGPGLEVLLAELRAITSSSWSHVAAWQYMAGQQALFAVQACLPEERNRLALAYVVATRLRDFTSQTPELRDVSAGLLRALSDEAAGIAAAGEGPDASNPQRCDGDHGRCD